MSDRIEILRAWQDAALIERNALVVARDEIGVLMDERAAGDYPRVRALDAAIAEIDRSIAERDTRIEKLARVDTVSTGSSRLTLLLRRQDEAREDRAALVEARSTILAEAEDMGLVDLNDEQDRRFRALTREIAEVDDEVAVRDEEIDRLATLSGVSVDS